MCLSPLTWSRQRHVRDWWVILEITVGLCSLLSQPSVLAKATRSTTLGTLSAEFRISPRSHCGSR